MSKYLLFIILFLLVVSIIVGLTSFSLRQIDYSDKVFFLDYPNSLYLGNRIINRLSDVTFFAQKIYSVADKLLGVSNWSKDAFDVSGHEVDLLNLTPETKCYYVCNMNLDSGVTKLLVWIGTGRRSNSYIIYNNYTDFEAPYGRRIECVYGRGFWASTVLSIKFYDEKNQDYLYDSNGNVQSVYLSALAVNLTLPETTISDVEDKFGITILSK